jgi:hypothetical protein
MILPGVPGPDPPRSEPLTERACMDHGRSFCSGSGCGWAWKTAIAGRPRRPRSNSKASVALYSDFSGTLVAGLFRPFGWCPRWPRESRALHHPRLIGGVSGPEHGITKWSGSGPGNGRAGSPNEKGWPKCSFLKPITVRMDVIAFSSSAGSGGSDDLLCNYWALLCRSKLEPAHQSQWSVTRQSLHNTGPQLPVPRPASRPASTKSTRAIKWVVTCIRCRSMRRLAPRPVQ